MIELRWIVPAGTTTDAPILQWRVCVPQWGGTSYLSDWLTVPRVVVMTSEFEAAKGQS